MNSSIYRDIIDGKVAEWRNNLTKLEEQIAATDREKREELSAKIEQLRLAIDKAVVQLLQLDKQETVENTVETKNKILSVFDAIDKDFPHYEDITPYML